MGTMAKLEDRYMLADADAATGFDTGVFDDYVQLTGFQRWATGEVTQKAMSYIDDILLGRNGIAEEMFQLFQKQMTKEELLAGLRRFALNGRAGMWWRLHVQTQECWMLKLITLADPRLSEASSSGLSRR
jgi:hypothetical protein